MNEIMTLSEVAEYLKIATKTVSRMIQRDEIPCFKISGQWRFKKSSIDYWLENKMNNNNNNNSNISNIYAQNDLSFLPIYKLIDEKFIVLDIKGKTPKEVLNQLVNPLVINKILDNTDKLVASLLHRENMASTAISKGVAFPHCRKPEENEKHLPPIIVGVSKEGVFFDQNKKTHLFFLILVNDEVVHLRILSKLSRLIIRDNLVEKLSNVENQKEIINILMESEYEHMA